MSGKTSMMVLRRPPSAYFLFVSFWLLGIGSWLSQATVPVEAFGVPSTDTLNILGRRQYCHKYLEHQRSYLTFLSLARKGEAHIMDSDSWSTTLEDLKTPSFWKDLQTTNTYDTSLDVWRDFYETVKEDGFQQKLFNRSLKGIADKLNNPILLGLMVVNDDEILLAMKRLDPTTMDVLSEHFHTLKDSSIDNNNGTKLQRFQVNNNFQPDPPFAYFVSTSNLRFRHQGGSNPLLRVYLQKQQDDLGSKVLVFFGASGTGKSVELSGSAYTRSAHLSLVWCPAEKMDDIQAGSDEAKRKEDGLKLMETICDDLKSHNLESLVSEMANILDGEKDKLRIVFCMDEMGGLPVFLRTLIAAPSTFARRACGILFGSGQVAKKVEMIFSVAGTGVSRGSVGSLPENFVIVQTSCTEHPAKVYLELSSNRDIKWNDIEASYHVLFTLMKHNGRMLSIAVKYLDKLVEGKSLFDKMSLAVEGKIVQEVIHRFVASNALGNYDTSLLPLIAASALAVHLFQEDVKITSTDHAEELASSLDYGLVFATDEYKDLDIKKVSMKSLVSKTGLLVPKPFPKVGDRPVTLESPFILDRAMQLVCVNLLSSPENDNSDILMLGLSSFAFEVLSADLVKSTIAASMVVHSKKRMSVQNILAEKLGFFFEENWNLDETGKTRRSWDLLHSCIASRISSNDEKKIIPPNTYFHRVPGEVVEKVNGNERGKILDFSFKELLGSEKRSKAIGSKGLRFDIHAMECLLRINGSASSSKRESLGSFVPPITSIAFGNSPLADGYVTMMVQNEDDGGMFPYTIMIQSKEYSGTSTIDASKVAKNAAQCYDKCLDVGLGENRLVCVASRMEKLTLQQGARKARNFLGFGVDKSQTLGLLLADIDERRNAEERQKQFSGVFVRQDVLIQQD